MRRLHLVFRFNSTALIASSIVAITSICAVQAQIPAVQSEVPTANTVEQTRTSEEKITAWFAQYDRIRKNALMSKSDKMQLFLSGKKADKRNVAVAARMIQKYSTALGELQELPPIPETKELQDGYIQYFNDAKQVLQNYSDAQSTEPFNPEPLIPARKNLEELDRKNKTLDAQLRKAFGLRKTFTTR